jgi:enamine deaminase RidA (YjgF/YER057c/UK114 family)
VRSSGIQTVRGAHQGSGQPSLAAKAVKRQRSPGFDLTTAEHDGVAELHLSVRPLPGETPAETVTRLTQLIKEHKAVIIRQEVFGSLTAYDEVLQTLRRGLGDICWPVTFVEGGSCGTGALAGMHVLALIGAAVETVTMAGQPVGRAYCDAFARHLVLGDLRPADLALSKPEQARLGYEKLEAALAAGGMGMPNLARTWLFLDDVLSWYGPFNGVRTRFYQEHGVFDRMVPASTGVSGSNVQGAALVVGAWAAQPLREGFSMREVASPKQCPAPCYGSSFSRAVELLTPDLQRLMVSGTASIEPGGASVGGNDAEAQIDLTMEVVRAILVSRELDFPDVSRATAYFKRAEDVRLFENWRRRHGLESWPLVSTVADICRDELLFEIEVDALGTLGSSA